MRRRVPRRLIWVYTVCSGLSVRIHTVNSVYCILSVGPSVFDVKCYGQKVPTFFFFFFFFETR